jgi:uncharacterized protein YeaO (DUF488 family)
MELRLKRVHDRPEPGDGHRVLVDRLWPRGLSKDRAKLDEWMPDLGPSDELRRWFGHRPERFDEFRRRYVEELGDRRGMLADLRRRARSEAVTLVFAAKDRERNNAVVLADVLRRGLR